MAKNQIKIKSSGRIIRKMFPRQIRELSPNQLNTLHVFYGLEFLKVTGVIYLRSACDIYFKEPFNVVYENDEKLVVTYIK